MNSRYFLCTIFITGALVACKNEKPSSVVCYNPSVECSHRFGCYVDYICMDKSINNANWYRTEYDCVSDKALSDGCAARGFPCENRRCAPPPVPCENDDECPELGVCDPDMQKCVEHCVCFKSIDRPRFPSCNLGRDCESDLSCGKGFYCDPVKKKCNFSYCWSNPCSSGSYCQKSPTVENFCSLIFDEPIGTCILSTHCENNDDCTDPLLPQCDDRGTCVPQ